MRELVRASQRLAREPLEAYETRGLAIGGLDEDAARLYWEQRAFGRFDVTFMGRRPRGEEEDAVLSVLMNTRVPTLRRGQSVDREVHIPARPGVAGAHALNVTFTFSRAGRGPVAVQVSVHPGPPAAGVPVVQPPAGYATRDIGDLRIEAAERSTGRRLTVTGLDAVPADERVFVKLEVAAHFEHGSRNTEIDVIVPISQPSADPLAGPVLRRLYYTFRFQPSGRGATEVRVERIGEDSPRVRGRVRPRDMDVSLVRGFPSQGTPEALIAWCRTRYPGVTLQLPAQPRAGGRTRPPSPAQRRQHVINAINAVLRRDSGAPDWFLRNYDLTILDAVAAETRLRDVHRFNARQLHGLKEFTEEELHVLEFALQSMSENTLRKLRGVRLVRQDQATRASRAGRTLWSGADDVTVLIFDRAMAADDLLFLGGARGTRPASTMTFVHELGHVVGEARDRGAVARAFARFIRTLPRATRDALRTRFTWYAVSSPGTELFPEAFALFHEDPEWMEGNWPEVFAWFQVLGETGAPPPAPPPARRR